MAVERQLNVLGQSRIDATQLRMIESAVAGDFDVLAGDILAGKNPLVVHGFEVILATVGTPVTGMTVRTSGGVLFHPGASESGSVFRAAIRDDEVLSSNNTRIIGSFTASTTNYVGIDLRRTADATTADVVQFLDPDTNLEKPKTVPLARTLDYVFYISTQPFSTNLSIAPLFKVITDANNNIVSVEDARGMFGRLGSGGSTTDVLNAYPWSGGRTIDTLNASFTAGDKSIASLKDWMDASMTRMWELGGGERWYSPTADRNVVMMRAGTTFSNGEWFEVVAGPNLHWRGLSFVFDNSTVYYNEVADQTGNTVGLTDLADGECIYVDLDRSNNIATLNAKKAVLINLGAPAIPGSRFVIAWRNGTDYYTRGSSFPVGSTFTVAAVGVLGIVQLTYAAGTPSTPTVMAQDANGSMHNTATGGNGYGLYGEGNGTGAGLSGKGGATNGNGVEGLGDGASGIGVKGIGGASGVGVAGYGQTAAAGVEGYGAGAGAGLKGVGGATGNGVTGVAAVGTLHTPTNTKNGGVFTGDTSGAGVDAKGGGTNGIGIKGLGGASNGIGVRGEGDGTGAGVSGLGGDSNGPGGSFTGGTTNGVGVVAQGTGTSFGGTFNGYYGIDVVSTTGDAITASATGGNGLGILAGGHGSGYGAELAGGSSAGATAGYGAKISAGSADAGGTSLRVAVESVGNVRLSGTAPVLNATLDFPKPTVTPANTVRYWGDVLSYSVPAGNIPVVGLGFGSFSAHNTAQEGAVPASAIRITMATALSSYMVMVTPGDNAGGLVFYTVQNSTTKFDVYAYDIAAHGTYALQATGQKFNFVVYGIV